jgi:hypothetical protein
MDKQETIKKCSQCYEGAAQVGAAVQHVSRQINTRAVKQMLVSLSKLSAYFDHLGTRFPARLANHRETPPSLCRHTRYWQCLSLNSIPMGLVALYELTYAGELGWSREALV